MLYRQLTFKGSTRNVATKIYKNGMGCFTRNVATKIYKSWIEHHTNLSFYIQTMIRFHVQILVLYCHMEMFVKMMSVRWGIKILEKKWCNRIDNCIYFWFAINEYLSVSLLHTLLLWWFGFVSRINATKSFLNA